MEEGDHPVSVNKNSGSRYKELKQTPLAGSPLHSGQQKSDSLFLLPDLQAHHRFKGGGGGAAGE